MRIFVLWQSSTHRRIKLSSFTTKTATFLVWTRVQQCSQVHCCSRARREQCAQHSAPCPRGSDWWSTRYSGRGASPWIRRERCRRRSTVLCLSRSVGFVVTLKRMISVRTVTKMRSKGLAIRSKGTWGDSPCFDSLKAIRLDKDSGGGSPRCQCNIKGDSRRFALMKTSEAVRLAINVIIREIQDDSPW